MQGSGYRFGVAARLLQYRALSSGIIMHYMERECVIGVDASIATHRNRAIGLQQVQECALA